MYLLRRYEGAGAQFTCLPHARQLLASEHNILLHHQHHNALVQSVPLWRRGEDSSDVRHRRLEKAEERGRKEREIPFYLLVILQHT